MKIEEIATENEQLKADLMQLGQQQAKLVAALEMTQAALSVASHELRDSLMIVMGFTQHLRSKAEALSADERVDLLDRIERGAGRIQNVVERKLEPSLH